jgi:hypothetical protein
MNIKKWAGYAAIALLLFFVVTAPNQAAASARNIGSTLSEAASSVTTFFTQTVG